MAIEIDDNVYLRSARSTANQLDIWFIHGFGESGLSFQEAFASRLTRQYNLFAPDFPGFGASPPGRAGKGLNGSFRVLRSLIDTLSKNRKIAIVAHSMGGILGTWLSRDLGPRVITYINVEGNLTNSDTSFSARVDREASAEAAHRKLLSLLWQRGRTSTAYQRYSLSL